MGRFKQAFMRYMDSEGIKYRDVDGSGDDRRVNIGYNCDNIKSVDVSVIFDDDDDGCVALRSWSLGKVPKDKYAAVLIACNELNNKFRWVKFCIDKDNDISCELDSITSMESVGSEVMFLVRRMVSISDDAYPIIMKAIFGGN